MYRMIRPHILLRLLFSGLLVVLVSTVGACDSSDAQGEFEDRAFSRPFEDITSTTSDGKVVEKDDDDWRVAPLYINSIDVVTPAYPNPTAGEPVNIEINVLFDDAVRGQLELYGYTNTQPRRLIRLDFIPESRAPGFYSFQFNPAAQDQDTGIRRVFVFDGGTSHQALVTYGDVLLE